MMKGNVMEITINLNPKVIEMLAAENEIHIKDLKSDIVEYFKSFEYREELAVELINNIITNY